MLSKFNNKCYKSKGNPQKLVFFIHGYNGTPEAIDYAVQSLLDKLEDAVVCVPEAPFVCEKNSENKQWLSFYEEDPDCRFRDTATSTAEIFDIFNRLGKSFSQTAREMNAFIDEMQQQWKIVDKNTFVAGFSQGAMLSLYTALIRKGEIGGCTMNAGIVAGKDLLARETVSRPKILLLHGEDDATVQYKTLPTTLSWLAEHNLSFRCRTYPALAHRMNDEEMQAAADFINHGSF